LCAFRSSSLHTAAIFSLDLLDFSGQMLYFGFTFTIADGIFAFTLVTAFTAAATIIFDQTAQGSIGLKGYFAHFVIRLLLWTTKVGSILNFSQKVSEFHLIFKILLPEMLNALAGF
jgi:hypothetical protein